MPLFQLYTCPPKMAYAIWHIRENFTDLNILAEAAAIAPSPFLVHPKKILEFLAVRLAHKEAAAALNLPDNTTVFKNSNGAPYRSDRQAYISFSHAFPYAIAIIDKDKPVGIDLQIPNQKLHLVHQKYLTLQEKENSEYDLEKRCVYWCAKESVYKIIQRPSLPLTAIEIAPFIKNESGDLWAHIGREAYYHIQYQINPSFIFTWCYNK